MPTLNLGIVAHVDAGKTTLTERLLFDTGVSDHIGSVDRGDTVTDTDVLERQRGITIRSAVVSFTIGDTLVNLIDTPGHSDFVAEVERALAVLDGAVLVVSAVEGVQSQTRVLVRTLERLRMPFLVFVNKIDRRGASYAETLTAVRAALTGDAVALSDVADLGTAAATARPRLGGELLEELSVLLADNDEVLLSRYVEGASPISEQEAARELARLTGTCRVHPVLFGSAITGAGIADLVSGIDAFLPRSTERGDDLHASVFKIERGRAGERVAYARLHAGRLSARDQVSYFRRSPGGVVTEHRGRVTAVSTFAHSTDTDRRPATAGEIGKVVGLADVEIGDQLGRWDPDRGGRQFASPGLEAVVRPGDPDERTALHQALQQLSAQDPLINARLDGLDDELTVSLYGEVQKEVLTARLRGEFGIEAEFLATRTVFIERPSGVGSALRVIGAPDNPDLATVGLRIDPGPVGSGIAYRREVELGGLLRSFHTAIEETVPATLEEGLYGWRVVDCVVTLTHSGYWAPSSAAGDFRRLTARVLREALEVAGTTVCEPFSEFEVEVPRDVFARVLHRLTGAGAVPAEPEIAGDVCRLTGVVPTVEVREIEQRLPGLSRGLGFITTRPAGHRAVHGTPPARRRPRPR